jgi:hypothetical protein
MALIDDPYNSAVINFGRNLDISGVPGQSSSPPTPLPLFSIIFRAIRKKFMTSITNRLIQKVWFRK